MEAVPGVVLLLTSALLVQGQRPSFAGSRPIGYPELANKTTTESGLADKFGDDTTTQRLPIEANGDRELVDRLSKLPIDKQPFWLINWQALEAHREKPQTYPQRPSQFAEPSLPVPSNTNSQFNNSPVIPVPSNVLTPPNPNNVPWQNSQFGNLSFQSIPSNTQEGNLSSPPVPSNIFSQFGNLPFPPVPSNTNAQFENSPFQLVPGNQNSQFPNLPFLPIPSNTNSQVSNLPFLPVPSNTNSQSGNSPFQLVPSNTNPQIGNLPILPFPTKKDIKNDQHDSLTLISKTENPVKGNTEYPLTDHNINSHDTNFNESSTETVPISKQTPKKSNEIDSVTLNSDNNQTVTKQ